MQRSRIESERQQNKMQITKQMVPTGMQNRQRTLAIPWGENFSFNSIIQNWHNYSEKKRRGSKKLEERRNESLSAKACLLST